MNCKKREKKSWLDVPPPEVRAHIAFHVSGGQHTLSALHLAKVNKKQREAVLASVPKVLHISSTEDQHQWTSLLIDELVAVSFESCDSRHFPDHAFALLSAPKLCEVCIPDDPTFLGHIANSSVSDVVITVRGWTSPALLFDTLATLPLKRLKIFCSLTDKRQCFNNPDFVGPIAGALGACCPGLTFFQMHCDCAITMPWHSNQLIQNAMPMLHALREVKIRELPSDSLELFSGLKSITVQSVADVQLLAKQLGPAASGILDPCGVFDTHQLRRLFRCTRLSHLLCTVREQTEFALAELLTRSLHLGKLAVFWDIAEVARGSETKNRPLHPSYAKMTPGVLPRAMSSVKLTSLTLAWVHIPLSDLTQMLKCVGPQLHYFVTSILDQEEEPMDRIEHVLYAAVKHCPNLLELGLCERAPEIALGVESAFWPCLQDGEPDVLCDILSRLHSSGTRIGVDLRQVAEVQTSLLGSEITCHGFEFTPERLATTQPSKHGCRLLRALSRLKTTSPKIQTEVLELMIRLLDRLFSSPSL